MITVKCPNCCGSFDIDPSKDYGECTYCGRKFSFAQLSGADKKRTINTTNIYNIKNYDEVLTLANLQSIKYTALVDRINIAISVKRYDILSVYLNELARRDPENPLVYEGRLLASYNCTTLEDLAELDRPFYNDNNFRLLYKFGDDLCRARLDKIVKTVKDRIDKQEKDKEAQKRREGLVALFFRVLSISMLVAAIFVAVLVFVNTKMFRATNKFAGALFGVIACVAVGAILAGVSLVRFSNDKDDKAAKILSLISCGLAAVTMIITIPSAIKKKMFSPFNPGNEITMRVTGVHDTIDYSYYVSTFDFTIINDSDYNITQITGNINIYVNGKSEASGLCWFSGAYNAHTTNYNHLELSFSGSTIYNATFDQMSITLKISKLMFDGSYNEIDFDCREMHCH